MRRNKGLGVGLDGREDTLLVESHAICTAAVWGSLEARAANLITIESETTQRRVGQGGRGEGCSRSDGGSSSN